jgi:hypothetical protein
VADDPGNADEKAGAAQPGAVKHDSRGNAVWQWAVETGKHAVNSTSTLLRRLELPGLSIEGEKPAAGEPPPKTPELEKRRGYDPYARSEQAPVAGRSIPRPAPVPQPPAPAPRGAAGPLSPPAPEPEARRPSWLRRLFGRR